MFPEYYFTHSKKVAMNFRGIEKEPNVLYMATEEVCGMHGLLLLP